jgi:hypothetical protein
MGIYYSGPTSIIAFMIHLGAIPLIGFMTVGLDPASFKMQVSVRFREMYKSATGAQVERHNPQATKPFQFPIHYAILCCPRFLVLGFTGSCTAVR